MAPLPAAGDSGYEVPMALKLLLIVGGLALFGSMIWDRFTGAKSARWFLLTLGSVMAGIVLISWFVAVN